MKSKIISISLFILTTTMFSITVSAISGNGTIEYEIDTDPTPVYHPDAPYQELDVPGTGMSGPLSLDFISNFKFNTSNISTSNEDITLTKILVPYYMYEGQTLPSADYVNRFVQVTDKRGKNTGWDLTVEQVTPFIHKDGISVLEGSEMHFNGVDANSINQQLPYMPKTTSSFILTPESGKQLVVDADTNQGMGTWSIRFGGKWSPESQKYTTLYVPGNSPKAIGEYKTTLLWTLIEK